jgi:transposase-like protein
MPLCPACQQPASKRNGLNRHDRQKYACRPCRRTFTENTLSAFRGYRWPRDVIVLAVRWYLAYPLSSRQVLELLAERGIDVSHRTVLNWVQTFGPRLAAEVRRHRRRGRQVLVRGRGVPVPQEPEALPVPSDRRGWPGRRHSAA